MRNVNFNPPRAYLLAQKVMKHTPKNGIAEILSRDVESLSEASVNPKIMEWKQATLIDVRGSPHPNPLISGISEDNSF